MDGSLGSYLWSPKWLLSSAANLAFRQSGLLAVCCRVRSDSLYFFVFHLSVSGVLSPERDAFILPWQSMTTTVHCERAFSRNSSLTNEHTACVYWPSCCSKPRHFCLWNIKREFQCIIAVIFQYHFIWNLRKKINNDLKSSHKNENSVIIYSGRPNLYDFLVTFNLGINSHY